MSTAARSLLLVLTFLAFDRGLAVAQRAEEAFQRDIANMKGAMLDGQTEKYPLLGDTF